MHVQVVKYEKLKNSGNFEHQKAGVEVALEPGEKPGAALERAQKFVEQALQPPPPSHVIAAARNILANPDDHTPKQVREAQTVIDHINLQGQLEF